MTTSPTSTQTALSAREAVEQFFAAFGSGDRAALLDLFAESPDWNVAGAPSVPWTGRRSSRAGIDAFLDVAAAEVAATEAFSVDLIISDGPHAVAFGSFTHVIKSTGKKFSSDFSLHVEVGAEGRIRLYHMFEDGYAAAQAFAA